MTLCLGRYTLAGKMKENKRFTLDEILASRQRIKEVVINEDRTEKDNINKRFEDQARLLEKAFYAKHRDVWLEAQFDQFSKKKEDNWARTNKRLPIRKLIFFEWKYESNLLEPWSLDPGKRIDDRKTILDLIEKGKINEKSIGYNTVYLLTNEYGETHEQFRITYSNQENFSWRIAGETKTYKRTAEDKITLLNYMADDLEGLHGSPYNDSNPAAGIGA